MPFVSLECIVNVEHIWIVERLFLFATIYMAKLVRKFRLIYITIAFVLACCDTVWYNAMILSQLKSAPLLCWSTIADPCQQRKQTNEFPIMMMDLIITMLIMFLNVKYAVYNVVKLCSWPLQCK